MAGIRYKGQIYSGAAAFGSADDVSYDNADSGLNATNVQDAVDELNSNKAEKNNSGTGYCKMPDGTMLCWGGESNKKTGDRITFPISFIGIPTVVITPEYNTQTTIQCIFSCAYANGNTGFNMYAWDIVSKQQSTSTTLGFRWQAVGRWK